MAEYDFIKMQKKLAKYLDEDRYEHTLGVMFTCAALAMVHDCDLITAQTAGLLHDGIPAGAGRPGRLENVQPASYFGI